MKLYHSGYDVIKNPDLKHGRKNADFFYNTMGLPKTLKDVGIGDEKFEIMAEHAEPLLAKAFVLLTKEDVLSIFRACEKEEL